MHYSPQNLLELYERVNGRERYFRQPTILGALYGLVECDSPRILLGIARVILAVGTNHLLLILHPSSFHFK